MGAKLEDLDIFHRDRWLKLTRSEKEAQLQKLADYYAAKNNIPRIKLKFDDNLQTAGGYNPEFNTIMLNSSILNITKNDIDNKFILSNSKDFNDFLGDFGFNRFQIMDSVIHEMRHAYQRKAVAHPEIYNSDKHLTEDQIKLWTENDQPGCYLSLSEFPEGVNRFQPLEVDAFDYAESELNNIFGAKTIEPQERTRYSSYRQQMAQKDSALWRSGLNYYQGISPILGANQDVHERYLRHANKRNNVPKENQSRLNFSNFLFSPEEQRKDAEIMAALERPLFNDAAANYCHNIILEIGNYLYKTEPFKDYTD